MRRIPGLLPENYEVHTNVWTSKHKTILLNYPEESHAVTFEKGTDPVDHPSTLETHLYHKGHNARHSGYNSFTEL